MNYDAVTFIGAIATLLGGMWAMFERQQKGFLSHLQQKNGHMERMDIRHQEATKEVMETLVKVTEQLDRANDNQMNVKEVLNDCARALMEHHKNCKQ